MSIVSTRLEKYERDRLREQARAQGFESLSDFIRFKLGLERGTGRTAPIPDIEGEQSNEGLTKSVHSLIDHVERMHTEVQRIGRHVGVPGQPPVTERSAQKKEREAVAMGDFRR